MPGIPEFRAELDFGVCTAGVRDLIERTGRGLYYVGKSIHWCRLSSLHAGVECLAKRRDHYQVFEWLKD
jgi:hypothetical protein